MTHDRPALDAQRGFTLIELLVSLAILSFIATVMLGGVGMVRQIAGRMQHSNQANDEVIAAQIVLRDRIEHLQANLRSDRADPIIDLQGNENVFSFYAPPFYRHGVDASQAHRLLRMATGDLVLFSVSSLSENVDIRSPSLVGWTPTRLLTGVGELSMSYLGTSQSAASGTSWQRYWINQPQPPQLIRIRLTFPAGDGRVWPDLVIRPRVTLNSACKIDQLTGRCKGAGQP